MKMRANALAVLVLFFAMLGGASGQRSNEVRRAQPVEETPIPRALPVEEATPAPRRIVPPPAVATPVPRPSASSLPSPPSTPRESASPPPEPAPEEPSAEPESPDRRQLDYANALFGRKIYDLAIPEYEKFLGQFPGAAGRASAFFYLGECYRSLNRTPAARTAFQSVLDDYGESEFAGPAAYGVAEILFNQKDYASAVTLFHRSAAKTKEAALALSARYFEARCLENLEKKDEAGNLYLQVVEAKDPNPFREDARMAAGSILLARGRKSDALKQYEALAKETSKPALKAEVTVRAGMVALDLQQADKGKPDKAMLEKATALLQKGRSLAEGGRWRGIAQVGLLRLFYSSGQYAAVLAEYQRSQENIPEEVRAEMMLLAANSERQLGHEKEAETLYAQIVDKYPSREEAKDARYQRLINIYNSNPAMLITEVDAFLASNPTPERADQAKLLKAESFYKQSNFTEAAPLYEDLRASQLSPKLRAECAYKLGWCYVQMKSMPRVVEAFTYFLKAFPENAQAPTALMQRALAHQETRDRSDAIADLSLLIKTYPEAHEREAALQQKALLLGQENDPKGMTEAFQQLLKEFPKSPVAAQAQYYIGKAAFEAKEYKAALPPLEAARKLNQEQYYTPATVRIISSYFYQKNRAALTSEIDKFLATAPGAKIPGEILQTIGIDVYNEKNYAAAEKYLRLLGESEQTNVSPDFWFYLGDAQTKLGKFTEAEGSYERYLQTATDPAAKVKTLLALGATKIAAHKPDDAQRIAEEIMSLQPEGKVNAEARLLAGDVQVERGRFEEAGKAFMSVALLYEDPTITPRALQKAAAAYEKAGKKAEAEKAAEQLRQKYPEFAGPP
ncbi:MAG TPA: tetratricopeptide repeat protein [Chthoniobacterales bacterium]|nr:tetratricopeptide repeat protein [Chthoniobacterales bacterium]